MTLLGCQIFSTIAREGSFARTAEQLHLTPSAISHAVAGMEAECGFPLFTRTKSGVTMTAAAESLLPAVHRLLASNESLDQSVAQINGMHKGELRLAVFNSACVAWLPELLPQYCADFPGIELKLYQGSYADIAAWIKNGTAEVGLLSDSCAKELHFEQIYRDPLVCVAPRNFVPRHSDYVDAAELQDQPFVSQRADTDADTRDYLKLNNLDVKPRCYVIDDESTVAMVACGQGLAIMPELIFKKGVYAPDHRYQVLPMKPAFARGIGLACLDRNSLSPAAREFWRRTKKFATQL